MAERTVLWKALADFSKARREADKTAASLAALRREQQALNASSSGFSPNFNSSSLARYAQMAKQATNSTDELTAAHQRQVSAIRESEAGISRVSRSIDDLNRSTSRTDTSRLSGGLRDVDTAASRVSRSIRDVDNSSQRAARSIRDVSNQARDAQGRWISLSNGARRAADDTDHFAHSLSGAGGGIGSFTGLLGSMGGGWRRATSGGGAALSMLGKWAAIVPLAATGIDMLSSGLQALAAGFAGIAGAAAPAAGVIAALPGIAAAAAGSVGTLAAGFSGLGSAMKAYQQAQKAKATTPASTSSTVPTQQATLANTAAEDARQNAQQIRSAEQSIARARVQAARSAYDNAQQIRQAEQSVVDAELQGARDIVAAERRVADAQQQDRQAEQAVNQARKDAAKNIADLRRQLQGQKLDQEAASLSLEDAQQRLRQVINDPGSTDLQRRQAELAVDQAKNSLNDTSAQTKDLTKQYDVASKKGVDGSDQVVSAKQAEAAADAQVKLAEQDLADTRVQAYQSVKKAQEGLATAELQARRASVDNAQAIKQAQQDLVNTLKEVALRNARLKVEQQQVAASAVKATAATSAYDYAMSQLDPAARAVVKQLIKMQGEVQKLQGIAQRGAMPGFLDLLKAVDKLFPSVARWVSKSSGMFGDFFTQVGKLLGSKRFVDGFDSVINSSLKLLGFFLDGALNIGKVIGRVMVAAEPLTEWLFKMADGWTKSWDAMTSGASGQRKLATFFEKTKQALRLLGDMAGNLIGIILDVGSAAGQAIGMDLLKSLDKTTQKWKDWTSSDTDQNKIKKWAKQAEDALKALGNLAEDVIGTIMKIGSGIDFAGFVNNVDRQLLPAVGRFLDALKPKKGSTFLDDLVGILTTLVDFATTLVNALLPPLGDMFHWLGDQLPKFTKPLGKFLQGRGKDFKKFFDDIKPHLTKFVDALTGGKGKGGGLIGAFGKLLDKTKPLQGPFTKLATAIIDLATTVITDFTDNIGSIADAVGSIAKFGAGAANGITKVINALNKADKVNVKGKNGKTQHKSILGEIFGELSGQVSQSAGNATDYFGGLDQIFGGIADAFMSFFTGKRGKSAWKRMAQGLSDAVAGLFTSAAAILDQVFSSSSAIGLLIGPLLNGPDGQHPLTGWLKAQAKDFENYVQTHNPLYDAGSWIIGGLWNGMKAAWDAVKKWLIALGEADVGIPAYKGPPEKDKTMLFQAGKDILLSLLHGFQSVIKSIWHWLGRVTDDIGHWVGKVYDKITGKFSDAKDWVKRHFTSAVHGLIVTPFHTAWDALSKVMGDLKNGVIDALKSIHTWLDKLGGWATKGFGAFRDAAKGPIDFVVNKIIKPGIVTPYNKLAKAFGLPTISWGGGNAPRGVNPNTINATGTRKIQPGLQGGGTAQLSGLQGGGDVHNGAGFLSGTRSPKRDNLLGYSEEAGRPIVRVEPGEYVAPRWMSPIFPVLESIRRAKNLPGRRSGGAVGKLVRPTSGNITQGVHDQYTGFPAIDFGVPVGTPVVAGAAGKVILSKDLRGNQNDGYRSYGRYIEIASNGFQTLYAHLSKRIAQIGQMVRAGQEIGLSGNTGNSTGPHLHFGAKGIDPNSFVTGKVTGLIKGLVSSIGNGLGNLLDPLHSAWDKVKGAVKGAGKSGFGQLIGALPESLFKGMLTTVQDGLFGSGAPAGSGAQRWTGTVRQALALAGISTGDAMVQAWDRQIDSESGGNPNIIQQIQDVNSANHNLARGLVQVTPTTFAAYRDHSLPNNIFNPLANLVAGMRWAKLGRGWSDAQILANIGHGHGYARGTSNAQPGWHWVGEKGPELLRFKGGEQVLPHEKSVAAAPLPGYDKGGVVRGFAPGANAAWVKALRSQLFLGESPHWGSDLTRALKAHKGNISTYHPGEATPARGRLVGERVVKAIQRIGPRKGSHWGTWEWIADQVGYDPSRLWRYSPWILAAVNKAKVGAPIKAAVGRAHRDFVRKRVSWVKALGKELGLGNVASRGVWSADIAAPLHHIIAHGLGWKVGTHGHDEWSPRPWKRWTGTEIERRAAENAIAEQARSNRLNAEWDALLKKLAGWGYSYAVRKLTDIGTADGMDIARGLVKSRSMASQYNRSAKVDLDRADAQSGNTAGSQDSQVMALLNAVRTAKSGLGLNTLASQIGLSVDSTASLIKTINSTKKWADIPGNKRTRLTREATAFSNLFRFATGGTVPGHGNGDTVPSMLEPGELVLRKAATASLIKDYGIGITGALNNYDRLAVGGFAATDMRGLNMPGLAAVPNTRGKGDVVNTKNVNYYFTTTVNNPIAETGGLSLQKRVNTLARLGILSRDD